MREIEEITHRSANGIAAEAEQIRADFKADEEREAAEQNEAIANRPRPYDRARATGREIAEFTATSAPCLYCGKKVTDAAHKFSVEMTTDEEFVFEDQEENPENSQGWHAVGSDCARVLRAAGVRVIAR